MFATGAAARFRWRGRRRALTDRAGAARDASVHDRRLCVEQDGRTAVKRYKALRLWRWVRSPCSRSASSQAPHSTRSAPRRRSARRLFRLTHTDATSSSGVARNAKGRRARSEAAKHAFEVQTGYTHGRTGARLFRNVQVRAIRHVNSSASVLTRSPLTSRI